MKTKLLVLTAGLLLSAAALHGQVLQYDFKDWVAAHLEYPQAAYELMAEATIPVAFRVAADGTISDVECRADLRRESAIVRRMAKAAVSAVAAAPAWQAAAKDSLSGEYSVMVEFEMPKFGPEVERKPVFPASEETDRTNLESNKRLRAWIAQQTAVSENFRAGIVGVVEKGGTLGHLKVVSTNDEAVAANVVAALEKAPKWTPGLGRDGEAVRTFVYLPLRFNNRDEAAVDAAETETERVLPEFEGGGIDGFRQWVMKRLRYPREEARARIQGTVLLKFVVGKEGSVEDIEVLHAPNKALSIEAKRVVANSPKWTPGHGSDGKATRFYYLLPVQFSLK